MYDYRQHSFILPTGLYDGQVQLQSGFDAHVVPSKVYL